MLEQVVDGHREVVIRSEQPGLRGDDAVAIVIGVAGDVETILDVEQALHRVRRRRVHADLSVPVEGHEAKGRIDRVAHHSQVDPVVLGDARPVVHAGAAERVDADSHLGIADDFEVDDVAEIADAGAEAGVAMGRRRP